MIARTRTTPMIALALALAATAAVACAKDPTSGKNKAQLSEAKPEAPKQAPVAGAEVLAVTPENSKIGFIGAKVSAQHVGHFGAFTGSVQLIEGKPEKSTVSFAVQTASVTMEDGGEKLVNHLKAKDFFFVEQFPQATFTSTEIKPGSDQTGYNYTVTGNLELRGTKKGVTFPARIEVTAGQLTVSTEFGINRKDWGIEYPGMKDDLIKDNVLIQVALTLPRPATKS